MASMTSSERWEAWRERTGWTPPARGKGEVGVRGDLSRWAEKAAGERVPKRLRVARALGEVEAALASGKLPPTHTADEHLEKAETFIARHKEGLEPGLQRLKDLAPKNAIVAGRAKDVESALGKLVRKPKYGTVEGLQDATGMRVVAENQKDVLDTVARIKEQYEVIGEDDYINKPQESGYRSYHLIVKDRDGLVKEMQVRTQNQHVWADWCHDIYKPQTPAQSVAVSRAGDVIKNYAIQTSKYMEARDTGKEALKPDCPPVVREVFGCI